MTSFDFMEATVAKVHAAYLDGSLTCRALCEYYLKRIEQLESRINSIICVNPKALEEADRFDTYVKERRRLCGALHGLAVTMKDKFKTTGRPTTEGSAERQGGGPDKDA